MNNRIAFLGDSLTHAGHWEEYFPICEIANFGIPGEKSVEILSRLDQVIDWQPRKIFLMMGVNDLGDSLGLEIVLDNYNTIIEKIKELKGIELIVQSILPINQKLFASFNFGKDDILETNHQLKELCEEKNIPFIDLHSVFSTYDNQLVQEYTYDGLHLNEAGYRVWKNCLCQLV